ncbi:MAG: tetratricopeptide repeat protein [Methylothermaceae bacterium]|nr:tetratricopeptide repeat protein [Methylothermaceae bacterium]
MSLKSYFPEQFDELKAFLISDTEVMRRVLIDPEMKPLLIKALGRMEESEEFPHAFALCEAGFENPESYFDGLSTIVAQSLEQNASVLSDWGVNLATASNSRQPVKPAEKFIDLASTFADSLPDSIGSLVFILDPEAVTDPDAYRRTMLALAKQVESRWLKFVVFDSRTQPLLDGIESENPEIGAQIFYLSPEEIEQRVTQDLQSPNGLVPAERRQYKGLLAGFAFANKDYERAETLQRAWIAEAEREGEPSELANAYYNLGNTLLSKKDFPAATAIFCKACEICVEHKVYAVAPFAYTNLGISLHRQDDFEQAFTALKVARDMFKAQNQRPGEAYVVDCLAQMYALDGRREEAAKAWRYALSIYEGITSPTFNDLREHGQEDIRAKLKRLGMDEGPAGVPREQGSLA